MIKLPKRFWEDKEWVFANYSELLKKHPNMWVAVLNKKIIAASSNLGKNALTKHTLKQTAAALEKQLKIARKTYENF